MATLLEKKLSKITEENPFYKMGSTLNLSVQLPKAADTIGASQIYSYLNQAWQECSASKEKRELFFSIVFSIGDIENREHNIFTQKRMKNVDGGGFSKRRIFAYCLKWILESCPDQFYAFMPIYGEYYNLDALMFYFIKTDRLKGNVLETIHIPIDVEKVTDYIASCLRNAHCTDNNKKLWARWLPHVPSAKRRRKYVITSKNIKAFAKNGVAIVGDVVKVIKEKATHTKAKDNWTIDFIKVLCRKMDWPIVKKLQHTEFKGYRKFKSSYNTDTESVLFSTKKILAFDKAQFISWLDQLPSGARHRVACRLVYKDKAGKYVSKGKWLNDKYRYDLGGTYVEWLNIKEGAQKKLREVTPEQKATMAPTEIKQLEKAAKVNIAGENLLDVMSQMFNTSIQEVDLKAQSILDKVKMDVPVMLCVDISGSMSSNSVQHKGVRFSSKGMAQLAVTTLLLKNPDPELGSMFIRFDERCEVVCSRQTLETSSGNRFLSTKSIKANDFVDRTKKFSENLASISQFIISRGATHITCIPEGLRSWVNQEPSLVSQRIEMINKYPVWLVVSDGDINNQRSAKESVMSFQQDMRQFFGWEGVTVLWDIREEGGLQKGKFEGLNNFIHLPGCNVNIINQVFKNIHDIDVVDTYTSLKTIHRSNRYLPVRELTA